MPRERLSAGNYFCTPEIFVFGTRRDRARESRLLVHAHENNKRQAGLREGEGAIFTLHFEISRFGRGTSAYSVWIIFLRRKFTFRMIDTSIERAERARRGAKCWQTSTKWSKMFSEQSARARAPDGRPAFRKYFRNVDTAPAIYISIDIRTRMPRGNRIFHSRFRRMRKRIATTGRDESVFERERERYLIKYIYDLCLMREYSRIPLAAYIYHYVGVWRCSFSES